MQAAWGLFLTPYTRTRIAELKTEKRGLACKGGTVGSNSLINAKRMSGAFLLRWWLVYREARCRPDALWGLKHVEVFVVGCVRTCCQDMSGMLRSGQRQGHWAYS